MSRRSKEERMDKLFEQRVLKLQKLEGFLLELKRLAQQIAEGESGQELENTKVIQAMTDQALRTSRVLLANYIFTNLVAPPGAEKLPQEGLPPTTEEPGNGLDSSEDSRLPS